MKNGHLLVLAITGSVIGSISFFIRPEEHSVIKYTLLTIAASLIIIFHLLIFRQVLRKENLGPGERIFWTIAIICLPLMGDIIYLIINDAVTRSQVLKHAWLFLGEILYPIKKGVDRNPPPVFKIQYPMKIYLRMYKTSTSFF